MKKNVASQVIGAQMVSATDGSAFTGAVTCYVCGDAGTQAAGSVGSGACTHEGNGYHTYAPAQAETNYDLIAFTFIGTGAVGATVQVFTTYPQTGDAFARLGAPAGASVSADIADVPTVAEFNARTLAAADYTVVSDLPVAPDNASITAILEDTGTTLDALIKDLPTVAEFEARTLPAASYFDPAADVVAHVTLVDTTTTLTNMPAAAPSAADIKTAMEADGGKLDHLWEMTEDDGGVRRLTTNALEQAPTGAGTSDLDELLANHDTEDTLGNLINDLVEEIGGLYRLTTAALAMAPGGGATTYSYSNTVDDGSGNLLDGVFVELATDSGMTNIVYTTHTNALGAFTVYSDTDGTHYLRLQLAGYSFTIQTVTLA